MTTVEYSRAPCPIEETFLKQICAVDYHYNTIAWRPRALVSQACADMGTEKYPDTQACPLANALLLRRLSL